MLTKFQLFESKQVGILYHFTNLVSLYYIIREKRLSSLRSVESFENLMNSYNLHDKSNWVYISFTRNKNFYKTTTDLDHPATCRITIDGNKLSNHYKIYPINYFDCVNEEAEECVVVQDELNISNYILKIEIPTLKNFRIEVKNGIDEDEYKYKLEHLTEYFDLEYEKFQNNQKYFNTFTKKLYEIIINNIRYDNYL